MNMLFFVVGIVVGAGFLLPIVHASAYHDGRRDGMRMRSRWDSKRYLRRVAALLDVTTECGEDTGEVVAWALQEADKKEPTHAPE